MKVAIYIEQIYDSLWAELAGLEVEKELIECLRWRGASGSEVRTLVADYSREVETSLRRHLRGQYNGGYILVEKSRID